MTIGVAKPSATEAIRVLKTHECERQVSVPRHDPLQQTGPADIRAAAAKRSPILRIGNSEKVFPSRAPLAWYPTWGPGFGLRMDSNTRWRRRA